MSTIVEIRDLVKYYRTGDALVWAVDHTDLKIERGRFTAVVGRSGSGKSTLLHMIGGLDRPDSGEVIIEGKEISRLKQNQLAAFRRRKIGFVFQDYNLIPSLNVWENVVLPLGLDGRSVERGKIEELLSRIGMADKKPRCRIPFRAVRSSGSPSRGRLPARPRSFSRMSRRAIWIPKRSLRS